MNERPTLRTNLAVWFAVLGAPLAWAGMHVVGTGSADAACSPAGLRWGLEPGTWALALTIAAGIVGVAALTTAIVLWRRSRTDHDAPPPLGRIHFLATFGLVTGPIFLFIILMAGLGATVLERCVQS